MRNLRFLASQFSPLSPIRISFGFRPALREDFGLRARVACAFLSLLVGSGCVHYRLASPPRQPQALPEVILAECAYSRSNAPAVLEWKPQTNAPYRLAQVKLPSPILAASSNKILDLEYYLPQKPSKAALPAIMILPVSAGAHYPLERHFARYFSRRGMAAVIVHRESGPDPKTADEINGLLRQSVADNSRVVDWIQTRPELDAARLGVLGTSMGAIKGSLFVAVDPRVKAAVLGLVGGDLPYILAYSKEGAWRGGGIVRRREAYLAEHHLTREQFRTELAAGIRYDPKLLAPYVDPKKVRLILGACDTIVPFKKGRELRREMGNPETGVVLAGHYTALLYLPYIRAAAFNFFQRHF
jgi:hypothetical protein